MILNYKFNRGKFSKFPKIKHLDDALAEEQNSEIKTYWISEKLDGANLGLYINKDIVSCFSRNGENANGLFQFQRDQNELNGFCQEIQEWLKGEEALELGVTEVYFWGEYFGSSINKRIPYDDAKVGHFKFYSGWMDTDNAHLNNCSLATEVKGSNGNPVRYFSTLRLRPFTNQLVKHGLLIESETYVGTLSGVQGKYSQVHPSKYTKEPANAEGYVIACFEYEPDLEYPFEIHRFKYKDPAFSDRIPPKFKTVTQTPEILLELRKQFDTYINKIRVVDTLSKTVEREKLHILVGLIIKDAIEDFEKDYLEETKDLDKKEKKYIYNAGSKPFLLLKEVLRGSKTNA